MNSISCRNLWIYAITNAFSRFGNQFQFFAVTGLTYAITGSTFLTAIQMAATGLPYILLVRIAGTIADRYDPRRVTTISLLLQAALTLGYLLGNSVYLFLALNFLVSSCGVFIVAAKGALIPQMVGKEGIFAANARLAAFNGGAQLFAPVIAGMIIMHINPTWAFLFNAVSYLAPAIGMHYVRAVEPEGNRAASGGDGLRGAWQFVLGSPVFLAALLLYGAYTLGMWSVNTLFYPYCLDILGKGMDLMGWNVSAYFGAFLITGYALERFGQHFRNPRLLPAGFLVGAVIWSGYTFTRSPLLSVLLSSFDGIVYTYTVTRLDTWIQEEAPKEQRGRVSALARAWEEVATVVGQIGGGAVAGVTGILGGMRWSSGISFGLVLLILLASRLTNRRAALPAPATGTDD